MSPIADYQQATHPRLTRALEKCLAKDPGDRWQSAHDLVDELRWVRDAGGREDVPLARGRSRERFVWTSLVALLLMALATMWIVLGRDRTPPTEEAVRFTVTAPENTNLSMLQVANIPAISPDGRHLAFVATDTAGKSLIWVRSFDTLDARPLPGTEGTITFFLVTGQSVYRFHYRPRPYESGPLRHGRSVPMRSHLFLGRGSLEPGGGHLICCRRRRSHLPYLVGRKEHRNRLQSSIHYEARYAMSNRNFCPMDDTFFTTAVVDTRS